MEITAGRQQLLLEAGRWQRRKIGYAKRRARTIVIPAERRHLGVRTRLAAQHLSGAGLEIGALHMPLRAPSRVDVRYVDRFTVPELREHYPELDGYDLVTPGVIDDGETLATVADASVDFVIANHMIEHTEDPIGTLKNHLRVLRPGGVIYMAVPDRRFTFDRDRQVTPLSHLRRDHVEGSGWSRRAHYEEWARFVDQVPPDEVESRADDLERRNYSIHFHVWTPGAFVELLTACRTEFGLPFEIDALERNDHEFIVILGRI
jgi:SAM-dependent methyltransferase